MEVSIFIGDREVLRMSSEEKKMFKEVDNMLKCLQNKIDAYKEAYNKGLEDGRNEVWELTKKLWYSGTHKCKEIFGYEFSIDIIEHFTPQEAIAKLEAYEKEQAEIKVGDVVVYGDKEVEILITQTSGNLFEGVKLKNDVYGKTGGVYSGKLLRDCKKTGKHIDIQSILQQIGGE